MVSTRHHPRPFPEPTLAPSRSPGSASTTSSPAKDAPPSPTTETPSTNKKRSASTRRKSTSTPSAANGSTAITPSKSSSGVTRSRSTRRSRASHFVHNPTSLGITWLLVSLPLVIWDTGYVLLRPHTFPGGRFADPIWSPYALYGTIDYIYGLPAYNEKNGFTAAQASLNVIETLSYIYYLWVIAKNMDGGFWSWEKGAIGKLWRQGKKKDLSVKGPGVEFAVLLAFSAYVMTFSKTVLYALNEYFSEFRNVGHNSASRLIFLWIIPNGAWIIVPIPMMYSFGTEILEGLKGHKIE